jgi:small subunit ribosomal protein S20
MPQGTPTKVKKRKKSVLKRARQSLRRAAINQANSTRVRTLIKRTRAALARGEPAAAGNLLKTTLAAIDHAIGKGVLHENTGNRYKSRLTLAYNALGAKKSV